jgi:branched-chain amino acid aminotransferase
LVLEWCDVVEVDEPIGILDEAEEVFLVSTTRDVQPVHLIDERVLVAPGPVTRQVQQVWSAREADGIDP